MACSQPGAVQGSGLCKIILDIVTSLFLVFNLSLGLLYVLNGTFSRDLKQGVAAWSCDLAVRLSISRSKKKSPSASP